MRTDERCYRLAKAWGALQRGRLTREQFLDRFSPAELRFCELVDEEDKRLNPERDKGRYSVYWTPGRDFYRRLEC